MRHDFRHCLSVPAPAGPNPPPRGYVVAEGDQPSQLGNRQAWRATVRVMMIGRDMDDERRAVAVHVLGRVQGVGYRAWVRAQAQRLGLTGWVSNELDGTVRAMLMGPEPAVTAMIRMLWQGPTMASVSAVQVEPTCPDHFEEPEGFRIIA